MTGFGLGAELSRHRLRWGALAVVAGVSALVALCLAAATPWLALAALLPAGFLGWLLVTHGRDRLVIHRNGFALHHRGRAAAVRWSDIRSVDDRLGLDRRIQMRSVTRRGGPRISFAPLMGGLVELHRQYRTEGGRKPDPIVEPTGVNPDLGAPVSVHTAPRRAGNLAIMILPAFFLTIALCLLYAALDVPYRKASDVWGAIGCVAVAVALGALLLKGVLDDRRAELRIHTDGFAYRHGRQTLVCRWDAIADFRYRRGTLSVMRSDGTWIGLSSSIPEVQTLVLPHARTTARP